MFPGFLCGFWYNGAASEDAPVVGWFALGLAPWQAARADWRIAPCWSFREIKEGQPVTVLTRRELLRVGGSALLGMSLAQILELEQLAAAEGASTGGPGWGKAKSVILV